MSWPINNFSYVADLAWQHLALSVPAIILSVLIAIPIGRYAFQYPRIGGPLLSATTLLYAIPALPLLILVPFIVGTELRSPATMIIALTIYGVALMVRTSADAFSSIDPATRDAAIAVGNSPRSLLWKVDLPLAIPVLVSGVRVVTVSTLALVTIGALIGIPSLGSLLTDGFQRNIPAEVLTGIAATMILALLLDGIVLAIGKLLTPWTWRRPRQEA